MIPSRPRTPQQAARSLAERIEAARVAVAKGAEHAETLALARRRKPGTDDPTWQEYQARPKAPAPAQPDQVDPMAKMKQRFQVDPAMKANKLGKPCEDGSCEVHSPSGAVIGRYR